MALIKETKSTSPYPDQGQSLNQRVVTPAAASIKEHMNQSLLAEEIDTLIDCP
jgi:hypothetical protein